MLIKVLLSILIALLGPDSIFKVDPTSSRDDEVAALSQEFIQARNTALYSSLVVMKVCRTLLMALAWKYPSLYRYFFYYETVILMLLHANPSLAHASMHSAL